MQVLNYVITTLLFISISLPNGAQSFDFLSSPPSYSNYKECAAILYNGKALVEDYSPRGKCKLEEGMKGKLSVSTVELTANRTTPVKKIGFKVAIKNDRTNTLWMYSEKELMEVQLEDILKKCEKGDRIIFMTVDQKISLPHHEIEILSGC